jgi:hypothetical protein
MRVPSSHSRRQIAVLDAAHLANIEQPQVYADTVLKFWLN